MDAAGTSFAARLTHADGKKLGQLGIGSRQAAEALAARIAAAQLSVATVTSKTLQQARVCAVLP